MVGLRDWFPGMILALAMASSPSSGQTGPVRSAADRLPDWADYMESLKPLGEKLIAETQAPNDPQQRQEAWQIMMATLAQGYIQVVASNPDQPEFVSSFNLPFNLAAPNPDYIYHSTSIRQGGTYRIRGIIGTNRFTDIGQYAGHYALGKPSPQLSTLALESLTIGADGSFDVLVSPTRPANYKGNWWKLEPGAIMLGTRVASYDWVHERDPVLTIEKLDGPVAQPPMSAAEIAERMSLLSTWVREGTVRWWRRLQQMKAQKLENRLQVQDWGPGGGAKGQVYYEGLYALKPGQALLLEAEIPKQCRYWSFLVGDENFRTVDWMNRQSSLNGYQGKVDGDGVFRAVISPTDPGVPNWLDTGTYLDGIMQVRWNNCSSSPQPTARLVDLANLRSYLPKATPVISPAERDRSLRDRRMGAQMRRFW